MNRRLRSRYCVLIGVRMNLRKGFKVLLENVREKRQIDLQLCRATKSLKHMKVARAFRVWSINATTRRTARRTLRNILGRLCKSSLSKGLNAWKRYANKLAQNKHTVALHDRILRRFLRRKILMAYEAWVSFTLHRKQWRKTAGHFLRNMRNKLLVRAWHGWKYRITTIKNRRKLCSRMMKRVINWNLSNAIRTWQRTLACRASNENTALRELVFYV